MADQRTSEVLIRKVRTGFQRVSHAEFRRYWKIGIVIEGIYLAEKDRINFSQSHA